MESLITYPGGKFYMLKDIIEIYDKNRSKAFVDVFGGSGKVLMNIDSKIKVYNDIDDSIINFFDIVIKNKKELLDRLNYVLNSRVLFNRYKHPGKNKIDDAFRYLYLNILSFNGQRESYSYSLKRNKSIKLTRIGNNKKQ